MHQPIEKIAHWTLIWTWIGLLMTTFATSTLAANDPQDDRGRLITDFAEKSRDLGWYVVNDTVMGGRSAGGFELRQEQLIFTGRTNTNGGGFSSIRTSPLQLDLAGHTGIRLHVMGDGRRYTWRLTTDARWRGREVAYWADFETFDGEWSTLTIPFASFVPRFRGYQLDGPALDPGQITGMGLMIYDDMDGPFELHLESVHAYSEAAFSLSQYRWAKRALVVSAASEDDADFSAQLDWIALTAAEFESRDMALVTLLDTATSTAEDGVLTAGEAHEARGTLGIEPGSFAIRLIGKDGSIKLSAERATPMAQIFALIDTMPMRQRELLERK